MRRLLRSLWRRWAWRSYWHDHPELGFTRSGPLVAVGPHYHLHGGIDHWHNIDKPCLQSACDRFPPHRLHPFVVRRSPQ